MSSHTGSNLTPTLAPVMITGIGSVSPYGPLGGLISPRTLEPTALSWTNGSTAGSTTNAPRRAFLVPPFRPASVVPGLKTRRLDRLSVWALVASSLAFQDAGIDLAQVDGSRVAVVFATAFGCVELTEAFYLSAASNGWSGTDPITFPETLASAPASHVSMFHGLRGPNITVSNKYFAGECAMMQAASLLRHGQADFAIVLSGDALLRSTYSWYEEANLLSPACYNSEPLSALDGFIPSEGVAALVMESSARIRAHSETRPHSNPYARIRSGRWTAGGHPAESIRQLLGGSVPNLVICSGNGGPCAASPTASLAREIGGDGAAIIPSQLFAQGLSGTGALFHLILGLTSKLTSKPNEPGDGPALFLGTARDNGFAAILLELEVP